MPKQLLIDDDDDGHEAAFKINKDYAERYDKWRQAEETQKLKDRYGEDVLESDKESDSSSEIEDDLAQEDTPQKEREFLRVLATLKSATPKIYDAKVTYFSDNKPGSSKSSDSVGEKTSEQKQEKPLFLKDYHRNVILERQGIISDDEDSDGAEPTENVLSVSEETRKLKESFKQFVESDNEDADDVAEGLFVKREKSAAQKKKEEDEYLEWLKGKESTSLREPEAEEFKPLKEFWTNPNLDDDEKFLRDYILNRRYREGMAETDDAIPAYDEIVDTSEDEEILVRQEQFERKFNFRFEEPDNDYIKAYPRDVPDSLRRKDEKRKQERDQHKKNVEEAKRKVREEIKHLKDAKRKEILAKLQKLKNATGMEDLEINLDDLEADFDPAEYDRKMREVFSSNYYGQTAENEKPQFSDSDEDSEDPVDYDDWQSSRNSAHKSGESSSAIVKMEVSNSASTTGKLSESERTQHAKNSLSDDAGDEDPNCGFQITGRRRRKRRSKLAEALLREKPVFDPNEKTFEEYFNEYYRLNVEDVVGDLPCRFKYRDVMSNDFGLTTEEVLAAENAELNAWVSVKKMSQYRDEREEIHDREAFKRKGTSLQKKQKILKTLFKSPDAEKVDDEVEAAIATSGIALLANAIEPTAIASKQRRRKRKKHSTSDSNQEAAALVGRDHSSKNASIWPASNISPPANKKQRVANDLLAKSQDGGSLMPKKKKKVQFLVDSLSSAARPKSELANGAEDPKRSAETTAKGLSRSQRKRLKKKTKLTAKKALKPVSMSETAKFIQQLPNERLAAYGIANPKRLKQKIKYAKKYNDETNTT